jgi:hypothetical protein
VPEQPEDPRNRFGGDMDAATRRLTREVAARNRRHLNTVADAVFLTHAGQPFDEVLAVLMRKSETLLYLPNAQALTPAARAISRGRRFGFI